MTSLYSFIRITTRSQARARSHLNYILKISLICRVLIQRYFYCSHTLMWFHHMLKIDTGRGKLTQKAVFQKGSIHKELQSSYGAKTLRYEVEFKVERDFGAPGALVMKNEHKQVFFLRSVSLQGPNNQIVHFESNSWIHPFHQTKQERVFFPNKVSS